MDMDHCQFDQVGCRALNNGVDRCSLRQVSLSAAGAADTGAAADAAPLFTDFTYANIGVPLNPRLPSYYETTADSHSHARTGIAVHGGVVVATVKLPPLGDTIVLMAHELQHVVEQTRGLDLAAEVRRPNSGVWQAYGGHYETQAAVDVSLQVAQELRESRQNRHK